MKRIFLISFVLLSFSFCAKQKTHMITQQEFAKLYQKENIQLLDVRTQSEYDRGFIKGAIKVDFYEKDFVTNVQKIFDSSKPIYLYCHSGGRSARATSLLLKAGFQKVFDLQGGYVAWKKQQK